MEAIGPHLRQLWRRAKQPGLIPMGLPRRILAQVHALRARLELLTWLTRRYTVSGRTDTERVPIIHAHWQPWPQHVAPSPAALAAPRDRVGGELPVRLVVQAVNVTLPSRGNTVPPSPRQAPPLNAPLPRVEPLRATPSPMQALSTPRAGQERLNPLTPHVRSAPVLAGAPSGAGEARSPLAPVLPVHPPGATAPGGASTGRLPSQLPPGSLIFPAAGVTSAGAPSAPSAPSTLATPSARPSGPLPVVQPFRGSAPPQGVPARPLEPRSSLRLVQPLPPTSATLPEGRGTPLPSAGAATPEGVFAAAPAPHLPRVVPRLPPVSEQQRAVGAPLVHPLRASTPTGSTPPAQDVQLAPAQDVQLAAAHPAPDVVHEAPPPAARNPRQDSAPMPRPQIDMDVLASKVRQRLLRQFAEEKVRRGNSR
jgi:hypothetical protein